MPAVQTMDAASGRPRRRMVSFVHNVDQANLLMLRHGRDKSCNTFHCYTLTPCRSSQEIADVTGWDVAGYSNRSQDHQPDQIPALAHLHT